MGVTGKRDTRPRAVVVGRQVEDKDGEEGSGFSCRATDCGLSLAGHKGSMGLGQSRRDDEPSAAPYYKHEGFCNLFICAPVALIKGLRY